MQRPQHSRLSWPGYALLALVGAGLAACGPRNFVLARWTANQTGTLGPGYVCKGDKQPCTDDKSVDESRFNPPNLTTLSLPECPHGIARILVQQSGTDEPYLVVQCAAPPGEGFGVGTATADGGVQPAH